MENGNNNGAGCLIILVIIILIALGNMKDDHKNRLMSCKTKSDS